MNARELSFAGRQRVRAPLLLCPMFLLLAALPWLMAEPMTGLQLVVSGLCLGLTCALARWSWPRLYRLQVRVEGEPSDPPSSIGSAPGELRWILDVEAEPDSPRGTYAVRLELDGVEYCTVLRNPDPDTVLRQLRAVITHWPRPVDCRWGLPEAARPWEFEPSSASSNPEEGPAPAVIQAPGSSKGLLWSIYVITLLMLTDLTFLVLSEGAKVAPIHPLSVLLPIVIAGCLVTIALMMATAHARLSVTRRVTEEDCLLGLRWPRGEVRLSSIRGVHVIGAALAERGHVLIDSADGPLALSVERSQAESLAERTRLAMALPARG